MTHYLSAINPFKYEAARSLLSGAYQAGCALAQKASEAAKATFCQNPIVEGSAKAPPRMGVSPAVYASRLVARNIQPYIDYGINEYLPTVQKTQIESLVKSIFAPKPPNDHISTAQSLLAWVIECIKSIARKLFENDAIVLVNNVFQRFLVKDRLHSICFKLLKQINEQTSASFGQAYKNSLTDEEIDTALNDCYQKLKMNPSYLNGVSQLGQFCMNPALKLTFTRTVFNRCASMVSGQIGDQLNALNNFLGSNHAFTDPSQKEDFAKRMTLEVMKAIVEELTDPDLEPAKPSQIHEGLEREARQLMKSFQKLIPEDSRVFEKLNEPKQPTERKPPAYFELAQHIDEIEEYVDEAQKFLKSHPWIAKGLRFVGFDPSAKAMQDRLIAMRINATFEASEPNLNEEEEEQHRQSVQLISGLLNKALRSPETVDILFSDGFSISSVLERYRTRLVDNF